MNIGILGTGSVAQALATGLVKAGHSVTLGSRHPASRMGLSFTVAGLNETAKNADVIVNATPGEHSVDLLAQMDADAFGGKLLIDVANAVTSSSNLIYPESSLGEKLQGMFPHAQVVKTLNTCAGKVFVNPTAIGPSSTFVSGDDAGAKGEATALLRNLGWPEDAIVDLGGISTAKGPEHYFIMWELLTQAFGTTSLNIGVVR